MEGKKEGKKFGKNKPVICATTWMNLKIILLSFVGLKEARAYPKIHII